MPLFLTCADSGGIRYRSSSCFLERARHGQGVSTAWQVLLEIFRRAACQSRRMWNVAPDASSSLVAWISTNGPRRNRKPSQRVRNARRKPSKRTHRAPWKPPGRGHEATRSGSKNSTAPLGPSRARLEFRTFRDEPKKFSYKTLADPKT